MVVNLFCKCLNRRNTTHSPVSSNIITWILCKHDAYVCVQLGIFHGLSHRCKKYSTFAIFREILSTFFWKMSHSRNAEFGNSKWVGEISKKNPLLWWVITIIFSRLDFLFTFIHSDRKCISRIKCCFCLLNDCNKINSFERKGHRCNAKDTVKCAGAAGLDLSYFDAI